MKKLATIIAILFLLAAFMAGLMLKKPYSQDDLIQDFHDIWVPNDETMMVIVRVEILTDRVEKALGDDEALLCYKDCMYQWQEGELYDTMMAWEAYMRAEMAGDKYLMQKRNTLMVPKLNVYDKEGK